MKRRAKITVTIVALLILAFAIWAAPHFIRAIHQLAHAFHDTVNIVTGSALVVAVCALVVAYTNFRRGNTAIIKLIDVVASQSATVEGGNERTFNRLDIRFKNLGIPLRNPSVSINGMAGAWLNLRLERYRGNKPVASADDTVLEKGMVATYSFVSIKLDSACRSLLSMLIEPDADRVCISVYSDHFLVRRFPLRKHAWLTQFILRWNKLSDLLSKEFEQVIIYKGRPIHKQPTVLRRLKDYRWHFEIFVHNTMDEPVVDPKSKPQKSSIFST